MSFAPADIVGSVVPVVTPFEASGAIDWVALERLIDWQIASGSHGISVTGTTGEPSALTLAERRDMITRAAKAVGGRRPFVPGTGTNNLKETIDLTQQAEGAGADAALVIAPYYNRPSQDGLLAYFSAVAQATRLPIVIYNIPGRTAVNVAPATMKRIRDNNANVVGVKESNKDFEQMSALIRLCGPEFRLYSGIELLCYPTLAVGGVGYVSATANVLPREVADIYNRWSSGDVAGSRELHYGLLDLNQALFLETNPGPLKWLMGRMGLIEPVYRLPLCEPSDSVRRALESVAEEYRLGRVGSAALA